MFKDKKGETNWPTAVSIIILEILILGLIVVIGPDYNLIDSKEKQQSEQKRIIYKIEAKPEVTNYPYYLDDGKDYDEYGRVRYYYSDDEIIKYYYDDYYGEKYYQPRYIYDDIYDKYPYEPRYYEPYYYEQVPVRYYTETYRNLYRCSSSSDNKCFDVYVYNHDNEGGWFEIECRFRDKYGKEKYDFERAYISPGKKEKITCRINTNYFTGEIIPSYKIFPPTKLEKVYENSYS